MRSNSPDGPTIVECKARPGSETKTWKRFQKWETWKAYGSRAIAEEKIAKLMEQHERLDFRIKP